MSAYERTGWRDMDILLRHREYGINVPCCDIDLCEYDNRQPKGLVELKRGLHRIVDTKGDPNIRVLVNLSGRAELPAWVACYSEGMAVYRVLPLNNMAQRLFEPEELMFEAEYVERLYALRGRRAPEAILAKLHGGERRRTP